MIDSLHDFSIRLRGSRPERDRLDMCAGHPLRDPPKVTFNVGAPRGAPLCFDLHFRASAPTGSVAYYITAQQSRFSMNQTATRAPAEYRNVDADSAGQRLDNFLLGALSGVPRSHVYRLIRSGQVRVNSGRVRAGYRLREGDRVRVPPMYRRRPGAAEVPSNRVRWLAGRILYEDRRVLVLDKPAGMPVHAGTGVDFGCIEALRSISPRLRAADLVHRLDRGTSGCLLVAKRYAALRQLHGLLRTGGVDKRYLALVHGRWPRRRSRVDAPLATRRRGGESVVEVDPAGKRALSRFRAVERFGDLATLVEVATGTGRTHQIRVHAAHAGHPLAADPRYGDPRFNAALSAKGLKRMFLHAHTLAFVWPDTGERFAVGAPLPPELSAILDSLERAGRAPAGRGRPS